MTIRYTDDSDEKMKHELSDCLWNIIVLADRFDINLEESFISNMSLLEKRIKGSL
ncbi:MAG: MazG nucleotide pyrophosphohydrolase domain-containing protein [Patescibacteria group bacterium]|nr:MazG nucleotide pyrophosphohydrolase domain-containing protein [Patescibacteria group bacterium]